MAEVNCAACEALKDTSPEFVVNGFTEEMCASFANNTGLDPTDDHNDCTDLNNMNDCLIGNMETEVEKYDVCDWREFMKDFINNLWTVLKAMICAICGLWTHLLCLRKSLTKLVNKLAATTGGTAFVRYYRDLGTGSDVPFWTEVEGGFSATLDIYMDCDGLSSGSKPADRDYAVIISNCTNYGYFKDLTVRVTYFSSGDTRPLSVIRDHQAQHSGINQATNASQFTSFSWGLSSAVLLKKGEHIKVNAYVGQADKGSSTHSGAPQFRLHQFVLTWIPVNVENSIDPSDILNC